MIEFKTKPFRPNFQVHDWDVITNVKERTLHNFVFSYCDYRIGGKVFTKQTPEFIEAFKKEKFWSKLSE